MARRHAKDGRQYPTSGLKKVEYDTRPKIKPPASKIEQPTEQFSETFFLPDHLRKLTTDVDKEKGK